MEKFINEEKVYSVDEKGNVYRHYDDTYTTKDGVPVNVKRVVRQSIAANGYSVCAIMQPDKAPSKTVYVHRLIAKAFYQKP